MKTWQNITISSDATYALGKRIGKLCIGGEIFLLKSDLGGGKTTFTKGLAAGLGSTAIVTSPTFTISRIYTCRKALKLFHFDFYRLQSGGIVGQELSEIINDQKAIIVVEWGEVISEVLPADHIEIRFDRISKNEYKRQIKATYPLRLSYLFKDLK